MANTAALKSNNDQEIFDATQHQQNDDNEMDIEPVDMNAL